MKYSYYKYACMVARELSKNKGIYISIEQSIDGSYYLTDKYNPK